MEPYIYGLCAVAAAMCAGLLLRGYRRSRYRLLFWSGLCFTGLTVTNVLLAIDRLVFPDIDLITLRLTVALISMALMVYGLIWDLK